MLGVGLIYLGSLKLHRFSGSAGRYYVVVPPAPFLRNVSGKRLSFIAEVSCSGCNDKSLEGLVVTFRATISAIKRSDGDYWYRVILPKRYKDVWEKIVNYGQIKLYLSLT
jgi:hypothetical protein